MNYFESVFKHMKNDEKIALINNAKKMATEQSQVMFVAVFSCLKNDREILMREYPEFYIHELVFNKTSENEKKKIVNDFIEEMEKAGKESMGVHVV